MTIKDSLVVKIVSMDSVGAVKVKKGRAPLAAPAQSLLELSDSLPPELGPLQIPLPGD